ncbi:MAG: hypothetical protein AB1611_17335 [bacterium]
MISKRKVGLALCNMATIGIFLIPVTICSGSFAQSSLPFHLSSREEKIEAFPCQDCHEDMSAEGGDENAQPQEHAGISLKHGGLRCFNCHDQKDRDTLQTVDHRRVSFSNMEEVCGGCHAADYRDWTKGIHGKLVGSWKGIQRGLRCVECHDVHEPKPITVKPERPPDPPAASHP